MSLRKTLACLVGVLAIVLAVGEPVQAQVTITITQSWPTSVLTYNPSPDPIFFTPFEDPVRWTADSPLGHLEVGQSFLVTGTANWDVTAITVPVNVFFQAVPGRQMSVQFWSMASVNANTGAPFGVAQTGVIPANPLGYDYWRFAFTTPVTLTAGAVYGFTIGYTGPANPQNLPLPIFQTRQSPDPFPNGRALFRENTPLLFVPQGQSPPYINPTDLVFYIEGTGGGQILPPPPPPNRGTIITSITGGRLPVGGISIDPKGVLQNATRDDLGELAKLRLKAIQEIPECLDEKVELRKVSLRGIEAALVRKGWVGRQIPDSINYLGGLQRIRYVLVYPEQQDIVLAGPAESWVVDRRGNVVGKSTGRPVMQLDDLLVALRSARQAAAGISCSIDPTKEGLDRLRTHVSTLTTIGDPRTTAAKIENVLGPQQITVSGVPASSHFASVLVAADYRMKRIAMAFEPSQVRGLPSFLQMLTSGERGMSNMLPRWWLEPQYEPIRHDGDGLAWELRGAAVKAMTEEDFLTAGGNLQHTGRANPVAQKWADLMTKHYDELAAVEPVFGELQNCMDLAIVAALIVKERLAEKASCQMPAVLGSQQVKTLELPAPKSVDSQASVMRKGRNWVISASGGVLINSWAVAGKKQKDDALPQVRNGAASKKTNKPAWWWD